MKNIKKFYQNKTVLITGATSGLGLEIAKQLSDLGTIVILHGKNIRKVKSSAKKIAGSRVFPIAANLSDTEEIKRMIKKINRRFKRIDILINNAGLYSNNDFLKTKYKDIFSCLQINLLGHIQITLAIAKLMKRNKFGRIINIASGSGEHGGLLPSFAYSLAKNGLIFMSRILPKELKQYNIAISCLIIRWLKTKMLNSFLTSYKEHTSKELKIKSKIHSPSSVAKKIIKLLLSIDKLSDPVIYI